MINCRVCGADHFIVTEVISYRAAQNENGKLVCYKNIGSEFTEIECHNCGQVYSVSDFESIETEF